MSSDSSNSFINTVVTLLRGVAMFLINGIKGTHKDGHIFIFIGFALTALTYFLGFRCIGVILLALTVWCVCFFRDPDRVIPQDEGLIVAPADGVISQISEDEEAPEELELEEKNNEKFTRISIFLNVFNVHVNRIPVKGTVQKAVYVAGKFLNANLDKSSKENERNILLLKTDNGDNVILTQIAGLIARRIVSYAKEEDTYNAGERYGIIRFGSRVDVFIPAKYSVNVLSGQTMIGGETVIAIKNK